MEECDQRPRRQQPWPGSLYQPTLEEASVRLLRVELFPAEGLPTRPMSGSRGMVGDVAGGMDRGEAGRCGRGKGRGKWRDARIAILDREDLVFLSN